MSSRFGRKKDKPSEPHFMTEMEIRKALESALDSLHPKEKSFCIAFDKSMALLDKHISSSISEEDINAMVNVFVNRVIASCATNPRMKYHIVDLLANAEYLLYNSNSMCVELTNRVNAQKEKIKLLELENDILKKEAEVLRASASRFKRSMAVSADVMRQQASALNRRAEQVEIGDVSN